MITTGPIMGLGCTNVTCFHSNSKKKLKEECPQTKILMNLNDYILTSSTQMVGLNEAWIIDKKIFVSPAIYQLLTDQDDSQTRKYVTSQLVVRTATLEELSKLKEKRP